MTPLLCIPKILKNESNSQLLNTSANWIFSCCVSQRYWKMKAIHNYAKVGDILKVVVVYPKDTEKWKQFTTDSLSLKLCYWLLCIPKILKNESNSQLLLWWAYCNKCCCVSQRYWKMKAIHNRYKSIVFWTKVVVYPKDTEKWKQFTTKNYHYAILERLLCIPKILKNESNSQHRMY